MYMYFVQLVHLTLVSVCCGLVSKVHATNHKLIHLLRFHLVVSSVYNLANSLDKDQTLCNFPPDLNKKSENVNLGKISANDENHEEKTN